MTVRSALSSILNKANTQNVVILTLTAVVSYGFVAGLVPADALIVQYANSLLWLYPKGGNGA